jgi:phosphonate transport system ATP-binding protein
MTHDDGETHVLHRHATYSEQNRNCLHRSSTFTIRPVCFRSRCCTVSPHQAIARCRLDRYRLMTPSCPSPGTGTPVGGKAILLELIHLSRRFGATMAVSDANLRIEQGEMTGVIGRSGAGKSTLLRLINRLIDPTEGTILSDGVDVTRLRGQALRTWRAQTAMIFQQFNLVDRLDVLTNVLIGGLIRVPAARMLLRLFTDQERAQAVALLDRLGLLDVAMNRAGDLSGGQQQRVAIARALMQRPTMVLADEPIASLDPLNAKSVMDALADLNQRDGITVVCNLHTLDAARAYCRRIIGMAAGRIVFDGPPGALTEPALVAIYGDTQGALDERITSVSLPSTVRPVLARS